MNERILPDELGDGGQGVVGEPHERIAVEFELPELGDVLESGTGQRRQHVVTEIQFDQVGETHESAAFDQAHGTALQDDPLQVEQSQPLEEVRSQLHQRIAGHVQHLHRRFGRKGRDFCQSHLRARHALFAVAPLALAFVRARRCPATRCQHAH